MLLTNILDASTSLGVNFKREHIFYVYGVSLNHAQKYHDLREIGLSILTKKRENEKPSTLNTKVMSYRSQCIIPNI